MDWPFAFPENVQGWGAGHIMWYTSAVTNLIDAPTTPIIFYGSSICPMVPPVRQTLQRARAPFEYVNISFDAAARQRVMEINHGNASVPTLVFPDGSTLTEPSDQALRQKLNGFGFEVGPASPGEKVLAALQSPMVRLVAVVLLATGAAGRDWQLLAAGAVLLLVSLLVQIAQTRATSAAR